MAESSIESIEQLKLSNDDETIESNQSDDDNENHIKTIKIRQLTDEELKKLENDKITITDFKKNKIEKETAKNWNLFYKRNKTNFFKNRYWTTREFEELDENITTKSTSTILFEIGCGVGNFLFPLLNLNQNMIIYACDFSQHAIELLKTNQDYKLNENRCFPFVCDLVNDDLEQKLPSNVKVDIVTLIFVLSAIHPKNFDKAIKNIYKILKPGGLVLLRDYGLYDHAMLRFQPGQKLDNKCYHRCDHTLTYFFDLNELENLFISNGFQTRTNVYVLRETTNIKEKLKISRVFVQSKFIKSIEIN